MDKMDGRTQEWISSVCVARGERSWGKNSAEITDARAFKSSSLKLNSQHISLFYHCSSSLPIIDAAPPRLDPPPRRAIIVVVIGRGLLVTVNIGRYIIVSWQSMFALHTLILLLLLLFLIINLVPAEFFTLLSPPSYSALCLLFFARSDEIK